MIVYHGSMHNFKKLRISKSLVDKKSTFYNEGIGIYFSTDYNTAKTYGGYVYTIEIDDAHFYDFRSIDDCIKYLNEMTKYARVKSGVCIDKYISVRNITEYMQHGKISIAKLWKEINLLLDNNEDFYNDFSMSRRESVYRALKAYNKKHLDSYMFTYHIPNIGIIKNLDTVKIIDKQKRIN